MPIPLGILAVAGAGAAGAASDYELLETTILSSNADSVTFSSVNQGYKHLQIRLVGRSTRSAASDVIRIRLNNDSGFVYAWHYLTGDGSSVTSSSGVDNTSGVVGVIPAANATGSNFGATVIDILDYASTSKNTTIRSLNGFEDSSQKTIDLRSSLWANTAAVSTIRINTNIGLFTTGSRLSLYGIR